MSIVRETYYAALWALVEASSSFVVSSRRVRLLQDMEDAELPAVFMSVNHQPIQQSLKQAPIYRLGALVYLYCANPSQEVSADIALNGLIDALEAAIAPPPAEATQTLGGLVHHCWINGTTEIYPAPNGTRAAAIAPIEMMLFG